MAKFVASLVLIVGVTELALRAYGFAYPPLWVEDSRYEYAFAPSQDLNRFGQRVLIDSLGRRNGDIGEGCVAATFVGDSVINGGVLTDQAELATTLLDSLAGARSHVLNVSAGRWGPDNAVAFLRAHGDGDPQLLVAVFSSHDAGDEMAFVPFVGVDPSAPKERPSSAIGEAWGRYVLPRLLRLVSSEHPQRDMTLTEIKAVAAEHGIGRESTDPDSSFVLNPGWEALVAYSQDRGIPLVVYLHAETQEAASGGYNESGREILARLDSLDVPVVQDVGAIRSDEYRDHIHLNARGQAKMAERLAPFIRAC